MLWLFVWHWILFPQPVFAVRDRVMCTHSHQCKQTHLHIQMESMWCSDFSLTHQYFPTTSNVVCNSGTAAGVFVFNAHWMRPAPQLLLILNDWWRTFSLSIGTTSCTCVILPVCSNKAGTHTMMYAHPHTDFNAIIIQQAHAHTYTHTLLACPANTLNCLALTHTH